MKRFLTLFLIVLLCPITSTGCTGLSNRAEPVSRDGFFFDTVISVNIYNKEETEAQKVLSECFELCGYYENLLSNTIEDSEICKINNSKGEYVKVSEDTRELIEKALKYGDISHGKLDITMGRVINLWDFSGSPKVPDKTDLENALKSVNYKNVLVDDKGVKLLNPDTILDLGGIAKGFICDKIRQLFIDRGIDSAIINLGGNVGIIGKRPNGSDFRVGIQDPNSDTASSLASVEAPDKSVVTSGTYQRFFVENGTTYHHILDPKTGYPCNNNLLSVSIISENSTDCDALSTSCFLLGLEEGLKLIESINGTEALFVLSDGSLVSSSGWESK